MIPNLKLPELIDWPSVTKLSINSKVDELWKISACIPNFKTLEDLDMTVILDNETEDETEEREEWIGLTLYNVKTWIPKSFHYLRLQNMDLYDTIQQWTDAMAFDSFKRNGWLGENELNIPNFRTEKNRPQMFWGMQNSEEKKAYKNSAEKKT